MAFFKLRLPGRFSSTQTGADALSNAPAESVEVIRKRARHRLMGSVVLVLGAVVGLPLLFDSQPRPVAIDTPIVIPDRNQISPLSATAGSAKTGAIKEGLAQDQVIAAGQTGAAKSAVTNSAGLDPHEEVVPKDNKAEAKAEAKLEPKSELKAEAKSEPKSEPKSENKPDAKEAAKAKALLDGKEAPNSGDAVRSVVQVGAYADLAKAKEARAKLESAGFKTYTQEIDTKDGKRIRVRVGPFATKEEADKTAEKIRKLNLQASVLKL
ncbi:MAG: SPOR domain-containing protein [Limnohabitans sp.]|jgi:DedD protein|nr:SPOR domain-containing protein [Limnohabitans sp.]